MMREDQREDLPVIERHIPPALARIVDRCLEKNSGARFQSTRDLAFDLEGLSSHSDTAAAALTSVPVRKTRERMAWMIAAATTTASPFHRMADGLRSSERKPAVLPGYGCSRSMSFRPSPWPAPKALPCPSGRLTAGSSGFARVGD